MHLQYTRIIYTPNGDARRTYPVRSGSLSEILILLGDHDINVEYMYSYAEVDGHAKIAFKTSTPEKQRKF